MTKKHFIALADALKAYRKNPNKGYNSDSSVSELAEMLADFCQSQNPQFNRERWLSYIAGTCGKNGGKVK